MSSPTELAFSTALVKVKSFIKDRPLLYKLAIRLYPFITVLGGMLRGRRGVKDHLLSTYSYLRRSAYIRGRPMNVTLEPTSVCNLRCPVCETGAGILGRPGEHMSFEQFKIIIDKVALHTNTLMFYFMGEPFLNKEAYRMIRYAKDIGIPWITTCTNGDPVNPGKLVESGIDEVSFQIGGMTQATHETYRINSNLERVMRNLEETLRIRRETGSQIRVICGFILMKHNEHEVPEFKRRMAELGVDEASVIDPCVRTMEQGYTYLPTDTSHWYYDVEAFKKGVLRPKVLPHNECPWIYYSLSIHVNGDVVPCCRDPVGEHVMGNLLRQDLDEVWNGERYREFRNRLHRDQGSIDICRLCSAYPVSQIK